MLPYEVKFDIDGLELELKSVVTLRPSEIKFGRLLNSALREGKLSMSLRL